MKYLRENISTNAPAAGRHANKPKKGRSLATTHAASALKTMALDWETDDAECLNSVIAPQDNIDLLILCDCVYNDYLIEPLVQTCVDVCSLRGSDSKTVVLVAQQLRSDSIFEEFLETMMKYFDVWRVPEGSCSRELGPGSGYVVHLAALKQPNGVGAMK